MRCDVVQRELSDRLDPGVGSDRRDDVDADVVATHVGSCDRCAAFAEELSALRRRLRVTTVEPPPDIASAVRQQLDRADERPASEGRRRWAPPPAMVRAAAVFVVAFTVAATAVGLAGPRPAVAVEVDRLVREGQHRVASLVATVTVVERGWHPAVPERRYQGSLAYRAPEGFHLSLDDVTSYPSSEWRPNDVRLVVDDDRAWSRGSVACPSSALPACAGEPRTRVVTGREPFDDAEPVPLELVVPVDSFGLPAADPASVTEVAGRDAVAVTVTVAQVRGLLDGVTSVGAWRELHPSDRVVVALDAEYGVPLSVEVRASDDDARGRWAATNGYAEDAGTTLLTWELTDVRVNDVDASIVLPPAPASADATTDRGFAATTDIDTSVSPPGFQRHRAGTVDIVSVVSWTDGRAWLRVRRHPGWTGERLFGRQGDLLVRRVVLGDDGIAYVAEGGDQVFVHTAAGDIHVEGSVGTDRLLALAADLAPGGRVVPRGWAEASSATLADAREILPQLLAPAPIAGFVGPSVRIAHGVVVLAYAGNGQRGFVLTQVPGRLLSPPLDAEVSGVAVRDHVGRFTPKTGTLEWVEDGVVVSLRSDSLSLGELLAVAARLEPPRGRS